MRAADFLNLRVRPHCPNMLTTSEGDAKRVYVLIEVLPGERRPTVSVGVNVALVLDVSGSMRGHKINYLQQATRFVVDQMRDDIDQLAIITFSDRTSVIHAAGPVRDRSRLKWAIDELRADGGTWMADGMQAGLKELGRSRSGDFTHRMILLTDGETEAPNDCLKLARQAGDRQPPIAISTIGLGDSFKEKLLQEVADASRGRAHHLTDPYRMADIFRDELAGAQQVVAVSPTLSLKLPSGVRLDRITQCRPEIVELQNPSTVGGLAAVRLPDLDPEHGLAVLLELALPSRAPGAYRIAQCQLATDQASDPVATDLVITYTHDAAQAARREPEVMQIVDKVSLSLLQQRAMAEAQRPGGDRAKATQMLRNASTRLLELGDATQAEAAKQAAEELARQGQISSGSTKKLTYSTRNLGYVPQLPE